MSDINLEELVKSYQNGSTSFIGHNYPITYELVMGKYVRGTETKLQKETQNVHQLQKKVDTLHQTNETLYCDVAQLKEQNAEKKMQNAEMK